MAGKASDWRFAFAPAPDYDDQRIEVEVGRLRRVSRTFTGPWEPYRFVQVDVAGGKPVYRMQGALTGCGGPYVSARALLDVHTPCDGADELYVRRTER